jgi:hypothetical protein
MSWSDWFCSPGSKVHMSYFQFCFDWLCFTSLPTPYGLFHDGHFDWLIEETGVSGENHKPAVSRKWYEQIFFCVLSMSWYFNVSYMYNNCFYHWFRHCLTLYLVTLSMFNEVWWEVIVRFDDIVGSIHNYCLNVKLQLQLMVKLVSINFNVVISRCTRYNIMWYTVSVTCDRALVFSGYSGFLHTMTEILL